jgi:F0F1-type ATP synthase delta subunit
MAKISHLRIAAVIADKADRAGVSTVALSQEIAAYLLDSRRSGELDSVIRDVMQIRADRGIVEVIAVSAHPIDAKGLADIETQVRGLYPAAKQIIISTSHDPDVVGGVRLELANQQLDLSIRSKLNRFKQLTTA